MLFVASQASVDSLVALQPKQTQNAQNTVYKSSTSTLQPFFSDAKYQFLKFRYVQKAKFCNSFGV